MDCTLFIYIDTYFKIAAILSRGGNKVQVLLLKGCNKITKSSIKYLSTTKPALTHLELSSNK